MGFRHTEMSRLLVAERIAASADAAARRPSGRDALAAAHTKPRREPQQPAGRRRFPLLRRRLPNA